MNSEVVDFLMSQPNGASYVVLYQMLCLKTINTGGRLTCQIGDIIIPFDIEKIQRDCKWFSLDTVRVALGLYKQLGLIYEEQDGTLVLVNHAEMVGSETDYSAQKRLQRENRRRQLPMQTGDSTADNSVDNVHGSTKITAAIKDNILYAASFRGFIGYSSFLPSTFQSAQRLQQKAQPK